MVIERASDSARTINKPTQCKIIAECRARHQIRCLAVSFVRPLLFQTYKRCRVLCERK